MHKVNNLAPFQELILVDALWLTTSEADHHSAKHLAGSHGLRLWLFNSQQIIIQVKIDV